MSKLQVHVSITDTQLWKQTITLLHEITETTKDPETKQRIINFVNSLGNDDE